MAMICKLCGSSSSRLSASSKLKKGKEPLQGPDRDNRRSTLAFLWLLGFITVGSICFLLRCDGRAFVGNEEEETPLSCENKAQIFLQHSNVSHNQLHALATLFSESDQVLPISFEFHIFTIQTMDYSCFSCLFGQIICGLDFFFFWGVGGLVI